MPSLTSLPDVVLRQVLLLVPPKDRLTSCCLVSKRLHAAAIAATHDLTPKEMPRQAPAQYADSVLTYLNMYGHHLTKLQLSGFPNKLQQLPCPELRELQLDHGCCVQLGPSKSHPGVISGCTKLTVLQIECRVSDAPEGSVVDGALSRLVKLEHLQICPNSEASSFLPKSCGEYKVKGLSSSALQHLQQLTHLSVLCLSVENLKQVGTLKNLQTLHLEVHRGTVGPSSDPGLAFPPSLKALTLASPVEVEILSLLPAALQLLQIDCEVHGPAEGHYSFLHGMARLQQLTSLLMGSGQQFGPDWPLAGRAYSALTASSNLVSLELYDPPAEVWQYVFPGTLKLPHLTSFVVAYARDEPDLDHDLWEYVPPPSWSGQELCSLVSCCPSLCRVGGIWLEHGSHVSVLHNLTGLTSLSVKFDQADLSLVDETFEGLAALRNLECLKLTILDLDQAPGSLAGLLPAAFLPITNLVSLTCLEYTCSPGDVGDMRYHTQDFRFSTRAGLAPNVWQQLLGHCIEEFECPGCGRSAPLDGCGRRVEEYSERIEELQDQVAEQEQQLAAQQQELAEQRELVAQLKRQLTNQ